MGGSVLTFKQALTYDKRLQAYNSPVLCDVPWPVSQYTHRKVTADIKLDIPITENSLSNFGWTFYHLNLKILCFPLRLWALLTNYAIAPTHLPTYLPTYLHKTDVRLPPFHQTLCNPWRQSAAMCLTSYWRSMCSNILGIQPTKIRGQNYGRQARIETPPPFKGPRRNVAVYMT